MPRLYTGGLKKIQAVPHDCKVELSNIFLIITLEQETKIMFKPLIELNL